MLRAFFFSSVDDFLLLLLCRRSIVSVFIPPWLPVDKINTLMIAVWIYCLCFQYFSSRPSPPFIFFPSAITPPSTVVRFFVCSPSAWARFDTKWIHIPHISYQPSVDIFCVCLLWREPHSLRHSYGRNYVGRGKSSQNPAFSIDVCVRASGKTWIRRKMIRRADC